ncbi:peptidoglycan-binding domain-containing protein [Rahnella sikkimica]|uniref:Peptidoglycan binding-like domain-containing protein n=1 Tax=Rahnella sikkimica TaxID=1805933 RepID=A0A2L1UU47_9GAMM|nr:peptidoglycan-binding domain-containing protein [Rahnella sikkimica]AVF36338.1 hypothetical protein BV494_15990 [Rahnella sikkimica]
MFSSLSRSVGYFGDNLFHDVIEVQYRLKNSGFPDLVVDGNCGQKTVAAISQGNARLDATVPPASDMPVSGGVRRNVRKSELNVFYNGVYVR